MREHNAGSFKQASSVEDEARTKALQGAAQAIKPSWAGPMPATPQQGSGEAPADDSSGELEAARKEIDKLKRENEVARQNLDYEKLQSKRMAESQRIRDEERAARDRIARDQQGLERRKALAEAEEIRHRAELQKQVVEAEAKVQQAKGKAVADISTQQAKMQLAANERARAAADKYRDEARRQIESERVQAAAPAAPSPASVSPALKHVMTSAIGTLGKVTAPRVKVAADNPNAGTSGTDASPGQLSGLTYGGNRKFAIPGSRNLNPNMNFMGGGLAAEGANLLGGMLGIKFTHRPNMFSIDSDHDTTFSAMKAVKELNTAENDSRYAALNPLVNARAGMSPTRQMQLEHLGTQGLNPLNYLSS